MIIVNVKSLRDALRQADRVTDSVYPFVRLVVKKGRATLIGGSIGHLIAARLKIRTGDDGTFALPSATIGKLLAKLSHKLEITIEENSLSFGKGKLTYKGSPLKLPLPEEAPAPTIRFNRDVLFALLNGVVYAAADAYGRFALPVILLESGGKVILAAALDGHRIAVATQLANAGTWRVLIPKDAIPLINSLKGSTVLLSESESNLFFHSTDSVLTVLKSNAVFPPYQKPFNQEWVLTFDASVSDLARAVSNAQAILEHGAPGVLFERKGEELRVSYRNAKTEAEVSDVLTAKASGEGTAHFRLNANYLAEFLDLAEGTVRIHFAGETKAVLFAAGNLQCVLVPING